MLEGRTGKGSVRDEAAWRSWSEAEHLLLPRTELETQKEQLGVDNRELRCGHGFKTIDKKTKVLKT